MYVLGVSNTTTTGPWSPEVAVFNNSTHALVCAASRATAGTPSAGPAGRPATRRDAVQEAIFYNQGNGDLTFTVDDLTAQDQLQFTLNIGTGVSFKEVRIGTEFGDDPWTAPASFTAPPPRPRWPRSAAGQLTNYKGTKVRVLRATSPPRS